MSDTNLRFLISERRQAILDVAEKHGATRVRLIGSVARVRGSADSDIDRSSHGATDTSLLDHAALIIELEQLLGHKVDVASDGWVKPGLRESIYRDAVAL